jgi:hypothetical protein
MLRPQYARPPGIAAGALEMADEKETPASATAMPRVRRRAPTIDLKATEVAVEPPPSPAADDSAMAQSETPVPPDYPTEPAAYETGAAAGAAESSDDPPRPSSTRARAMPSFFTGPGAAAGGLIGGAVALIVFGILWLAALIAGGENPADQRLAAIETQLREIAGRAAPRAPDNRPIEELSARLTRLENAAPRAGSDTPAAATSELQKAVADLARRADDNATAIREARGQADAALVAADAARLAVERNNTEALGNRVVALERSTKTLSEDVAKSLTAAGGDRPLRAAVAAQALRAAVERGDPYAAELTAAKALSSNAATFAPLEAFAANGLPGAAGLVRELSELAPSMQKAPPSPSGGFLDRLQASAEKLVRIRPIDEMPGDDPNAVISRAQAKAARGDLSGAAAELKALPADIRAPADAWIKKVEARAAALNASRNLVADALASLGKAAP